MLRKSAIALCSGVVCSGLILFGAAAAQDQTLLLRDPAISATKIAFIYAGDLWTANRDGSDPQRLTSSPVDEVNPIFSPDGSWIAYMANHGDNDDVYIIPTSGGQPKRLTWHPGADVALDWTPDGSAVAFASRRETNHGRSAQLYHVSIEGGLPEKQMAARVYRGRYDATGKRFAYIPFGPAYNGLYGGSSGWRGYRGGTTPSVTVMDIVAGTTTGVAGERVNDIEPMWMNGQVYFVSDRENKVFNIYRFNPASGQVAKISDETVWDIRAVDAYDGKIIYESGGRLKILDAAGGAVTEIRVSISPDLPQLRPQWKDASKTIESFDLSPTGKRVAITARGDVFTVPVKDGSTRNLTVADGGREYTALWSPDGKRIAYVDASNQTQRLVIEDQKGLTSPRRLTLGPDFYSLLDWGGDGKHIVYQNNHLQLFAMDLDAGRSTLISTGARRDQIDVALSPDGRWLAYTQEQANFNRDLRLYDFARGRSYRVTDMLADAASPAFSADGKYLYFAASTNSGPIQVGLDMSSQERPYRASLYAVVLAADEDSPVKPKTGDEGVDDAKNGDEKDENEKKGDAKPKPTRVDIKGISDRIVALPVAERNYSDLTVSQDGTLYYIRRVQPGAFNTPPDEPEAAENALMRFKFDDREAKKVLDGVTAASIAAKGEHIIVRKANGSLQTAELGEKPEFKPLDVSGMRMMVDPRAEWAQIFDEAWRMERAYFYDPNMHGLDWQAIYDRYRPLVAHVGRREDLTALIVEMIGEMQVGHNRTGGGDIHHEQGPGVGLLGVDLKRENGRHRIARIYSGENWNPFLKAPLAAPRLGVSVGDYILAVDGRTLGPDDNIFKFLQGAEKKQVILRVASRADGRNARDIVVETTDSEYLIRLWAWVEDNRKAVEEATDGRVGYVYLPNTAGAGYTFFNRMFFAQVDKEALIIDERSNGGGQAANYITDVLSRTYLAGWKDRDGLIYNTPGAAMYGPKVMMIDQDAGSGGDFLPYSFRQMKIGPLVGKRTWGGLIGISANPRLVDGGFLTVPFFRFFDPDYHWSVENEGVAPDIDVALDPIATNAGRDTQLERAIEEALARLETSPSPGPKKAPPYPTELGK
ncbi:MAG: PDZ domain-containing protein [Parvularculaceae bacterium]